MAKVTVEFTLKGGDKVKTQNEEIIKQLVEQGVQYKVLEGDINALTNAQGRQNQSTETLDKSYKDILATYKANEKELKALAIAGDTTSERYQELVKSVGEARAAIEDVNLAANTNKGTFDAVAGTLGGAAAGFSAVQGAMGLLGTESEEVEKALLKVQSALALSQGLDQFQKSIPAFKNLTSIVGKGLVGAFGSLKTAIIATGIGAFTVALGLIVAYWEDIKSLIGSATTSIQDQNNALIANQNTLQQQYSILELQLENYELQGIKTDEIKEKLIDNLKAQLAILKLQISQTDELLYQSKLEAQKLSFWERVRVQLAGLISIEGAIGQARKEQQKDDIETVKLLVQRNTLSQSLLGIENTILKLQNGNKTKPTTNNREKELNDLKAYNEQTLKLQNFKYNEELKAERENYEEKIKLANGNNAILIELERTYTTKILNIQERYYKEAMKEFIKYQEDFTKIHFFELSPEELEFNLDELKSAYEFFQRDVINDEITYRRRLFDIAFKADDDNLAAGIEQFKKTQDLNAKEFDFITGRTRKYLQDIAEEYKEGGEAVLDQLLINVRERSEINRKAFDIELIEFRDAELTKLKAKSEFIVENLRIDTIAQKRYLKAQTELYDQLIANFNLGEGRLNEVRNEGRRTDLKNLIEDYDLKLKKAKEAFGEESDKYQELQIEKQKALLELLELEKEYDIILRNRNKTTTDLSNAQIVENKKIIEDQRDQLERRKREIDRILQELLSTISEVGAAYSSYYDLLDQRANKSYDERIRRSNEAREAEINDYSLTAEEKANIDQRYALQQTKIEEERNKKIKDIEKRRADTAFTIQISQIIGNTSVAVMRALAELGPIAGPVAASLIGTTGITQLIAATNQRKIVKELRDGGILDGPPHENGGIPVGTTGISVEGGEYVINKKSTAKYLPLLNAINKDKGNIPTMPNTSGFLQNGGMMNIPQSTNQSTIVKTYVVADEVTNKTAMNNRIRRQSKF